MRLTQEQIIAIREVAHRLMGEKVIVRVFGSRAMDAGQGGDIDLFFETEASLPDRGKLICQLYGALIMALGDRKIDVIVKDANTPPAPIFEIARRTGVCL